MDHQSRGNQNRRRQLQSTSEAEWTVMVHGVHRTIFVRGILGEMDFAEKRIAWFCDNRGTIQAASKVGFRAVSYTHLTLPTICSV